MNILGVDEAGRGAFAGPLVVASICADPEVFKDTKLKIRDSKTLSEKQRELVYESVCNKKLLFHTVCITVEDINAQGIGWANTEGIKKVIPYSCPHKVIVDGYFPQEKIALQGIDIQCVVDADATIFPVILAGIIAKVTRDRIMKTLHADFAHYGWEHNKGYGTKMHLEAIRTYGICPHHRKQFIHGIL